MDTSGLRTLIVMLLICGGSFYLYDRNKRWKEFEGIDSELRAVTQQIGQRRSEIDFLTKKLEPLRAAAKEAETKDVPKLEAEIAALREELATLNTQWQEAARAFESAMNEVRVQAKQQNWPEIPLSSGEVLKAASISTFGQGFVTIQHEGGIKRVLAEDLPAGWVEKYSVDYVPEADTAELANQLKEKTETPPTPAQEAAGVRSRAEAIYEQELKIATEIRNMKMEANKLQQEGFRAAINKGLTGNAAAAMRRQYFQKADAIRDSIAPKVEQYKKLRAERLAMQQEQIRKENAAKPRQG